MRFSCVYDESQTGFDQVILNGSSEVPAELIERLHNGKTLSLYFDGIASHVKPNSKSWLLSLPLAKTF